ncbi:DNA nickase [Streptomyces sp. YIM 121038]|uniref:hemerythrin domain-containing protein n=1 Tax=Streptomyces sp. YIM 121038 TaxID=2136401 RepID=UPI001110BDAB|nr:hemerythrin domain-containing protein [Streptomyces sp. YIM 121038]QCX81420.1 DNA nickase [Streptomyces sp. YIM 121038]
MSDTPEGDGDVVTLLLRQHGDIRTLFDAVERATGAERRAAFRRLVRLLAVHETAEEEVLHPVARAVFTGGRDIVRERLTEEKEAKELLARLDGVAPDDPAFLPALALLRTEVTRHARAEERYEFPHVLRHTRPARLTAMAAGVRAAQAVAPLDESPLPALVDRARDAVREAMGMDGADPAHVGRAGIRSVSVGRSRAG